MNRVGRPLEVCPPRGSLKPTRWPEWFQRLRSVGGIEPSGGYVAEHVQCRRVYDILVTNDHRLTETSAFDPQPAVHDTNL